jgi:hypothetical protein
MKTDSIIMTHRPFYRVSSTRLLVVFFMLFMLSMTSCKQNTPLNKQEAPPAMGIHKSYERGPLSCTVDVDKSEMTIAERLNLTITVVVDENYEVELPATGDKLAQFGIVDYHTSMPELTDDHKKKISLSYVLEPFLSGDYNIPAMTVKFWKATEDPKEVHEIETEEIKISVKSLLPENFTQMKLHDIRPPVALPGKISPWAWAVGICGVVVVGGLIFFIVLKRRKERQSVAQRRLPPHEIAFNELEKLIAQQFVEKGDAKSFYYEITNILRRYIENRFSINAPEQTTEEFLEGLRTNLSFSEKYKELLKIFLMHCDLVKFAAYQPTTNDIQNTFNSCRNFISETKIEETVK